MESVTMKLLLIGGAGFAGTLLRYWISGAVAERFGESFPSGTLFVNLMGCLVVGFLYQLFTERYLLDPVLRTVLILGLMGGFTTFSSFGLQTFLMLRDGQFLTATYYLFLSNLGGLCVIWAGYQLARYL